MIVHKNILTLLCVFVVLFGCNNSNESNKYLPYYNTPDFTPHWFLPGNDSIKKMHQIGEFNFVDQNGKSFTLNQLKGQITVANFFFTNCGSICPKMTFNMRALQDSFQNTKVQVISFSVKPWEDSVQALKDYETQNHLRGKFWHLLTGGKAAIYSLARKSFFAEQDAGFNKDSSDFLHTEHLILVDPNLHIRGIYNGTEMPEVLKLAEDIRLLLGELP